MATFALLQGYVSSPSWWKDGDTVWLNQAGGHCSKDVNWEVLQTIEAKDWEDLDWSMCGIEDPESKLGWLSPEGRFYGCAYRDHDELADKILKKSVRELELGGWARIRGSASGDFICKGRLTAEQRNWLAMAGHDPDAGDYF